MSTTQAGGESRADQVKDKAQQASEQALVKDQQAPSRPTAACGTRSTSGRPRPANRLERHRAVRSPRAAAQAGQGRARQAGDKVAQHVESAGVARAIRRRHILHDVEDFGRRKPWPSSPAGSRSASRPRAS